MGQGRESSAINLVRVSQPRVLTAHLALAAAQVSFGLFPIFGHMVFRPGGLSPLAVGAWRVTAGAAILGSIALGVHGRRVVPARAHLARFVLAAHLGVAVNQGLFLLGLARSTPVNATLVMCLIPVFTFAIAAAVGQERFSGLRLTGVLVALGGTVPLLFADGFRSLGRYGLGNLLMVANWLCYSIYLIISKPLVRRYPPLVVIAWAYVLSLPFAPFFAFYLHGMGRFPLEGAISVTVIALLIAWRHQANIRNLIAGTEGRIGGGSGSPQS